ncbi:GldG family protein [candidate division KSB1 bacterium]|nr:GldG family protein [candidate division KSB1 bacterium]
MMKKYSTYFGLAGLVLLLIGLFFYSINGLLTTLNIIILAVGVVCILAWVVFSFDQIKTGLSSRSTKFGTNAAFTMVFILGILIVLNILLARVNYRLDSTAAKQFSLAEQTRKVLRRLDTDVKAVGFFKSGNEFQAEELFKEYSNISSRFNFEFIDPDKNPGMAKSYNVRTYGTVVVEANGKEEKINKVTEQELTNALIKVTREGQKKILFVQGHGEKQISDSENQGLSKAKAALEEQNYIVEQQVIAQMDSIPADATVLVFAGPRSDMFPQEADRVKKYLDRGGKVLLLLDPETPSGFSEFAAGYGINVGNDIVVDASGIGQLFGTGPTFPIVSQYEEHAITEDFGVMTFFPEARSVSKSEDTPAGVTVYEIAKTSQRSWAETSPITGNEIGFDPGQDKMGPISLCAVAEKSAINPATHEDKFDLGTGDVKSRLVVFGDSEFSMNGYFSVQGNGNLFLNAVNWLAQEEDLISVRAKDPEDRRLNLTQKQSKMILYLGVILLPLLIFAFGIWVYVKRK